MEGNTAELVTSYSGGKTDEQKKAMRLFGLTDREYGWKGEEDGDVEEVEKKRK